MVIWAMATHQKPEVKENQQQHIDCERRERERKIDTLKNQTNNKCTPKMD